MLAINLKLLVLSNIKFSTTFIKSYRMSNISYREIVLIGQHNIFAVYLVNCLRPFPDFNHHAITMQLFFYYWSVWFPRVMILVLKTKCHFRSSFCATSVMQRWTFIILINLILALQCLIILIEFIKLRILHKLLCIHLRLEKLPIYTCNM